MTKNIKKGQKVILSCVGHNNFFYPGDKILPVLYDTEADIPAFIGGGPDMTPMILPENAVLIEGHPDRKIIVWETKARVSH